MFSITKFYIRSNFASLFFSIFFVFFIVTSIVFFVKIASVTSIIQVDFSDLILLYSYILPNILFFTIPVSFFASAVISLSKLSMDYELIVLFSLGYAPIKIIHIFFWLSLLVSFTLLVLSIGLMPITYHLNKEFIYEKRSDASLNIRATEFGQKFGDWLVFIGDTENGKYSDIALFSNRGNMKLLEDSNETFIISNSASIERNNSQVSFVLNNGEGFLISDTQIGQINFDKMNINDVSKIKPIEFTNLIDYWLKAFDKKDNKVAKNFTLYVLISLFPTLSIFFILAFGVLNPRYDKNYSYFYIILTVTLYYILISSISKFEPLKAISIASIVWFVAGYLTYRFRIKRF